MKANLVLSELLNTMSVAATRGQTEDLPGVLKEASQLCRKVTDGRNDELATLVRRFSSKVSAGELVSSSDLEFEAPVDDAPVELEEVSEVEEAAA
jgi:hypothetical protein